MGRIAWMFAGFLLGATGTFVSMKYYVVHADDGMHLIPKTTAELRIPYQDIREFNVADWSEHRELALAIVQAEKSHLLQGAATGTIRQAMDSVIDNLDAPPERR